MMSLFTLVFLMWQKNNTESGVRTSSKSFSDSQSVGEGDGHSASSSKGADNSLSSVSADPEISQAEHISSGAADAPSPGRTSDHHLSVPTGAPTLIPAEANESIEHERAGDTGDGKVHISSGAGTVCESTDVHLNIRLPNGVSLREKFSVTSALRLVKDYVDKNQTDMTSYDLAIPYPRKIFTDEGMI